MEDRLKIRDLMAPYILQTTRMEPSKVYSAKVVKEMYEIPRRVILQPEEWADSHRQLFRNSFRTRTGTLIRPVS